MSALSFTVSLNDSHANDGSSSSQSEAVLPVVPQHVYQSFQEDGFVVIPNVLSASDVDALNDRLEEILRGGYDRGNPPDKVPRLLKSGKFQNTAAQSATSSSTKNETNSKPPAAGPLGFCKNFQNVKVVQVINVHKSDKLFRRLACCASIGKVVADLAGWTDGARLAQDQIWAKPPSAPPLIFHRDSPYFTFQPDPTIVTVWIALDDMDEELGPLEYVRGSHVWDTARVHDYHKESANPFFQANGGSSLLHSAAAAQGLEPADLDIVSMAGLKAGGLSIHNGNTWHGSGSNNSRDRPRRGLGLHFCPVNVSFTEHALKSQLWRPYVENATDPSQVKLPLEDFPITWQPAKVKESTGSS